VSFGPIARHYAVGIDVCPAYHAWRKGAVEKAAGVITQRWSRTLGDEVTADQAQAGLDRLCVRLDGPKRRREGITTTVGALAQAEGLRPVPARYPAVLGVSRTVSNQARISFRGNTYSVPPGHTGRRLLVRHRLGDAVLEVLTDTGVVLARHRRAPDGAGAVVCSPEHVAALEKVVLANFANRPPCQRNAGAHPRSRRWPRPTASAAPTRRPKVSRWWPTSPATPPPPDRSGQPTTPVRPNEHHHRAGRPLSAAARPPGFREAAGRGRGAARHPGYRPHPGPIDCGRT
jgi:hypothetical protein